jgi:2-polyprenyl-3-methyl-5-hydroxy-6-metoxy-1,4-benzoquinol methylase
MNKAAEFDKCLLCGSARIQQLGGYEKNFLTRCEDCQFVFCSRRPTVKELQEHYDKYPRAMGISSITLKRYEELLDRFEVYRNTNNLMDLGCGDGHFLAAAKKREWNVFGTEFNDQAVRICEEKGIQMKKGSLGHGDFQEGYFDVVTSFEVIEHINEPTKDIESIKSLVRSGGLVYVTTPNFNSISRNILGPRWNVIEYPEHLCYYTPDTLSKLFKDHGLKKLGLTTTGISLNRLTVNFANSSQATNKDESLRKSIEGNFLLTLVKETVNIVLDMFGKGDNMKGFFQKI